MIASWNCFIKQISGLNRLTSREWLPTLLISFLTLIMGISPAACSAEPRVQELSGVLDPGGHAVYRISGLKQGQRLYIYVETTSGSLDPLASLIDSSVDIPTQLEAYQMAVEDAISQGLDPAQTINDLRDQFTLLWDDDSGEGYAAAFEYPIPQDGDYMLLVSGALSALGRATFGSYRLLAGLDAPQVLTGVAEPTGEPFVSLDLDVVQPVVRVQEIGGASHPMSRSRVST